MRRRPPPPHRPKASPHAAELLRVAGLRGQMRSGMTALSQDGLTPAEQLVKITERSTRLTNEQLRRWRDLRRELDEVGISIVEAADLTKPELLWLEEHFLNRRVSSSVFNPADALHNQPSEKSE